MSVIQLPDYLPSRYRSWYDVYLDVLRLYSESVLVDQCIIRFSEVHIMESERYLFYQDFPLKVIKERAADYLAAINNVL